MTHFDGHCDRRFARVQDAFRKNFRNGWEAEGAAFSLYWEGEKVVDIWGGSADKSASWNWAENTMTTVFSVTKSVTSICLALLIDRKFARYNDPIVKYWPEFGKNGKDTMTIDMLLAHQAGLVYTNRMISKEAILNHRKMSAVLEEQKPLWQPGRKTGYHPMTFGWLVDQLVRRIDQQHRGVARFFKEEIADPYDIDFHIGMPSSMHGRVARLSNIGIMCTFREILFDPTVGMIGLYFVNPIGSFQRVCRNLSWMGKDVTMFNNPRLREMEIPAANGIGTARALAKLHSLVVDGTLLSRDTMEVIGSPRFPLLFDTTMGVFDSKGCGFMYSKSPQGNWLIGHMGIGGQNVRFDMKNRLSFAYLTNGLKAGCGDHSTVFVNLKSAVYKSIENCDSSLIDKSAKFGI